jgi:hypothetical protein
MVNELREMGIELMVSIWPTVDKTGENFNEMLENGYLVRVDRGLRINMDFLGNTIHFDPTNPGARAYVWNKAKQNYYDYGIKVFWLDEAEPEYTVYDFDNYRYHLGPNVRIGNLYPMMYAQTFFEGMQAEGQHNIINLLRCAWAGSQRYGELVWSGTFTPASLLSETSLQQDSTWVWPAFHGGPPISVASMAATRTIPRSGNAWCAGSNTAPSAPSSVCTETGSRIPHRWVPVAAACATPART